MLTAFASTVASTADWPHDPVLGRALAALAPAHVLRTCQEQQGTADADVGLPLACRMIEALYHPGRHVRVAFALLANPDTPLERCWPEGDVVYLHYPVRVPVSRRGAVVDVDGCAFEFYRFPNDRRLRGLRKFAARGPAAQTWQSWLDESASSVELDPDSLRRVLIRYVPEQKWIARLRARSLRTGEKSSVAVRSSGSRQIAQLLSRHEMLARRVQASSASFVIPDVVGANVAQGMLAVSWLRGDNLLDALKNAGDEEIMARVVGGLRSLHRTPLPGLTELNAGSVAAELRAISADLVATCPELRRALQSLVEEALKRLSSAEECRERATLHADFHWKQLRVHSAHVALFDLERLGSGDPWVDVANFTTQLRLLAARPDLAIASECASHWSQAFLTAWRRESEERFPVDRFVCFGALSALRLARGAMRHLRPGWRSLTAACVDHVHELLAARHVEVLG